MKRFRRRAEAEERTRVIQITQEVLQEQAWQERAHSLEAEKENDQRNDALCERIREVTVQLPEANWQVERQEKLLRQKERDLQIRAEKAARMARLVQEGKDATEKRESDRKDAEVRFQRLQKDVEDITKETYGLHCEVQVGKLKRNEIIASSRWIGRLVSRTNGTTSWKMRLDRCEERRRNWFASSRTSRGEGQLENEGAAVHLQRMARSSLSWPHEEGSDEKEQRIQRSQGGLRIAGLWHFLDVGLSRDVALFRDGGRGARHKSRERAGETPATGPGNGRARRRPRVPGKRAGEAPAIRSRERTGGAGVGHGSRDGRAGEAPGHGSSGTGGAMAPGHGSRERSEAPGHGSRGGNGQARRHGPGPGNGLVRRSATGPRERAGRGAGLGSPGNGRVRPARCPGRAGEARQVVPGRQARPARCPDGRARPARSSRDGRARPARCRARDGQARPARGVRNGREGEARQGVPGRAGEAARCPRDGRASPA
ncbi:hornerin-like [Macrobrachium nipponense]|uniref:hornerin-like n=1 Tax=Macrobrachium nipponense TaxID=159736 RepID=UPI0030C7A619